MNQVAQASIGNPVKSRNGHATVAGSNSAFMSLGIFLGKAQTSFEPKSGELLD